MPPRCPPAQSPNSPRSSRIRPPAAGTAPAADGPGALDAADAAFAFLVTGPRPLALNPARCWPGLPDRMVPLGELKALLLHPSVGPVARNKVWAELICRARAGSPAWTVGLVGVAMPGLRRATASLAAAYHGQAADLEGEVLTGFLAAMRALDLDDLDRVPLASRLCWAAWRAGRASAYADAAWAARRRGLPEGCSRPVPPWGHPDFVLAAAARAGILTRAEAALIGRNRLEHVPLSRIAAETGIGHTALCNRRARAERKIAAAIRSGELAGVFWPAA
jgi:hypothetical protein